MRDDLVMPATARRLASAGLAWEPAIGDWCTVLGAEHVSEASAGLWLVVARYPAVGLLALAEPTGQWPVAQVSTRDCLWLPAAGQLKTWLRARSWRVTTGESPGLLLGGGPIVRHVCRLSRPDTTAPVDGEGTSEAEAVAAALLHILGAETADAGGW